MWQGQSTSSAAACPSAGCVTFCTKIHEVQIKNRDLKEGEAYVIRHRIEAKCNQEPAYVRSVEEIQAAVCTTVYPLAICRMMTAKVNKILSSSTTNYQDLLAPLPPRPHTSLHLLVTTRVLG